MASSTVLDLVVQLIPIEQLWPDPENPRRIEAADLDALERSIREFGIVQPLIVRAEGLTVIGGNQRLAVLHRLGISVVPCILLAINRERAKLLGIALNKTGGQFDLPMLAHVFDTLAIDKSLDLTVTGFRQREVDDLLRTLLVRERRDRPETFDLDSAFDQALGTGRVQRGDLFQLRDHRILCGDSAVAADLERALDGQHAAIGFTDPPFNVDLGNHGGQIPGRRRRTMKNDSLDPDDFHSFVRAWATNLVTNVEGALYVCMSSRELPTVSRIMAEVGGHWSDTIIYAKPRFVVGRADYQHQFEPVWYGWPERSNRYWSGARDQSNLWHIDRPPASPLHPAMKPLDLIERALRNSSHEGDVALDPFLGSGSTLVACERTGRTCVGVEIDPRYVEVAIRRWESFSGEAAIKLTDGATKAKE